MKTYQAEKRSDSLVIGVVFFLTGLLFAGVGLVSLVRELVTGHASQLTGKDDGLVLLAALGIGGAIAYLGWLYVWRRAYEVRLPGDGSVELAGILRCSKIASSDLLELERSTAKITVEDGDARELRVRSRRGTLLVPYFQDIELLVSDIQTQNPHIAVTGSWPGGTG